MRLAARVHTHLKIEPGYCLAGRFQSQLQFGYTLSQLSMSLWIVCCCLGQLFQSSDFSEDLCHDGHVLAVWEAC